MHSENNCDIEEKKCNTSQKYKKEDIILLAQNCGVDIFNEKGKVKSRKELCRDITNKHKEPVVTQELDILLPGLLLSEVVAKRYTETELNSKKLPELKEIAEDLGIKKSQKKADLIQAILDNNQSDFPIVEPSLDILLEEPRVEIESKKYTERSLSGKKLPELKVIAGDLGVKKNQRKADLIQAILEKVEEDMNVVEEPLSLRPLSPRPLSPRPLSPRPLSPRPQININIPTITELIKKKTDELTALINLKKQQECNPLKGIKCDDNKYCNIDKNICISSEEAMYKQNKGLAEISTFNDQNIVGSKSALDLLNTLKDDDIIYTGEETKEPSIDIPVIVKTKPKNKRGKNSIIVCDICTFVNDLGSKNCAVCNHDLSQLDKAYNVIDEDIEIDNIDDSLGEGVEITNIENIQNILNEIQTKDNISIRHIDTAKRKVLSCLGLLA